MGVIAKNKNKITLYYSSENSIGKQTYAYVTPSEQRILAIDVSKTKVTGTQWAEIASNLDIPIGELIDQEHTDFIEEYGDEKVDLDEHDWLRILEKKPSVLAYPIVIKGNVFLPIKNPSDYVKFIENDSAGIDKPYEE
ncbi:arsenate reductase family protein [Kriegella aquimaris]|uniref:Arsenate reductase, glutaredoxin family n=1 Tax=Kriegella aquimaris TaxID=192904 RepID=A0A1G9R9H8_9FLAO|nr:hypothetical protein [Kriegella aquimaris]SDM19878.1 hypothetical protein SAMN04488514_10641 [Kriegella aquimaris]